MHAPRPCQRASAYGLSARRFLLRRLSPDDYSTCEGIRWGGVSVHQCIDGACGVGQSTTLGAVSRDTCVAQGNPWLRGIMVLPGTPVKPPKKGGRSKDYIHHKIYANSLSEVPFDPKFVDFTFDPDRFVKFKATSLEKNAKHDLKTESHMGISVDLINTDDFQVTENDMDDGYVVEDEKDRALLREDKHMTDQEARRVQLHNQSMTFFHRTQYISSEFKSTNKLKQDEAPAVQRDPVVNMDAADEVAEIERMFAAANGPIPKHPLKPKLKPVSNWPVYPDFKFFGNLYTQMTFESNPNPSDVGSTDEKGAPLPKECESGILLGMMDEEDQYASYFAPTKATVEKKHSLLKQTLEDEEDYGEYAYKFQKDYAWHVIPTDEEDKSIYFSFREDKQNEQHAVYYNQLQAKIKLQSRRKGSHLGVKYEDVMVTNRELNAVETAEKEERMQVLQGSRP